MSDKPGIVLSKAEIQELTGYERATKQLAVLRERGFLRAFINKGGAVVLERAHYEAVSRGELHQPIRAANLGFLKRA
jgi:hypothetical protein